MALKRIGQTGGGNEMLPVLMMIMEMRRQERADRDKREVEMAKLQLQRDIAFGTKKESGGEGEKTTTVEPPKKPGAIEEGFRGGGLLGALGRIPGAAARGTARFLMGDERQMETEDALAGMEQSLADQFPVLREMLPSMGGKTFGGQAPATPADLPAEMAEGESYNAPLRGGARMRKRDVDIMKQLEGLSGEDRLDMLAELGLIQ